MSLLEPTKDSNVAPAKILEQLNTEIEKLRLLVKKDHRSIAKRTRRWNRVLTILLTVCAVLGISEWRDIHELVQLQTAAEVKFQTPDAVTNEIKRQEPQIAQLVSDATKNLQVTADAAKQATANAVVTKGAADAAILDERRAGDLQTKVGQISTQISDLRSLFLKVADWCYEVGGATFMISSKLEQKFSAPDDLKYFKMVASWGGHVSDGAKATLTTNDKDPGPLPPGGY